MNALSPAPSILDASEAPTEAALAILQTALAGADDGELFLERSESEMLVFDDGRLKSASYDATEGFGLRVVAGEKAGYAHASEISEAAIQRAAEAASAVKQGYAGQAAEAPRLTNTKLYGEDDPLAYPVFGDKAALLQDIDAFARARDPRVVQVSASIAGERRLVAEHGMGEGIVLAVELYVGLAGGVGGLALIALAHVGGGVGGATEGAGVDLAGMSVAGLLAGHHAQAEAFGGVIAGRLQPAVVEDQHLALGALEEQFAVVGAVQRALQDGQRLGGVDLGGVQDGRRGGERVHVR